MSKKQKSCLFIIGMHRTGTSAVAELLHKLGFCMGYDLIEPNQWNVHGYFESKSVIALNDELLAEGGAHWHTLFVSLPPFDALAYKFKPKFEKLLEGSFASSDLIAIKDPRLCRLLPVWQTLFREAGYRLGYLVVVRHPLACAESLARRDSFPILKSLWLWGLHLYEGLSTIDPSESIIIHYEDLLDNPVYELSRIGVWLEAEGWLQDIVKFDVRETIDPALSHALNFRDQVLDISQSPLFVRMLYQLLREPTALSQLSEYLQPIKRQLELDRASALPDLLALVEREAEVARSNIKHLEVQLEAARYLQQNMREEVNAARETVLSLEQQLKTCQEEKEFLETKLKNYLDDIPLQLIFFLDTPRMRIGFSGQLRISGWCFVPDHEIESLKLKINGFEVDCDYGHSRPDVYAFYSSINHSVNSGFLVELKINTGIYALRPIARLKDGRRVVGKTLNLYILPGFGLKLFIDFFKKYTKFVIFAFNTARGWYQNHRRLPKLGELPYLVRLALKIYVTHYLEKQDLILPYGFCLPAPVDPYQGWIELNRLTASDWIYYKSFLDKRDHPDWPLLSIVMPVYNPNREFFEAAIDSVRAQIYPYWELCIADDASSEPWVRERLLELASEDPRIRIVLRPENGHISLATNSAAELANGSYLCFLDQDDLLTPDALVEIALAIVNSPETDILYSDDDKIDLKGRRYDPQFKPDWSPELLLSYMYFSHLFVIRRELFNAIGGLRAGFEGAQDYDLALRATEITQAVLHIPRILYHWRAAPGSTAITGHAKPESFKAGERALNESFKRRGLPGEAYQPAWARRSGVGIYWHHFPDHGPNVTIIIPTKNNWRILKRCLDSLSRTSYQNYEIFVIDNESDDPKTLRYLATLRCRVISIPNGPKGFNFAAINNHAAKIATGDYLLFLNNDIEVISPQWLSQMVGYAQIEGVGAVGARLLFPNGNIQHAGIIHGYYNGLAGPAFKGHPHWDYGYLSYAMVTRNYSAVTAACLLTPRWLFEQVGGFDESSFAVSYNDVDYCYRLVKKGYRCVYAPGAELYHHEGYSRGLGKDDPAEVLEFKRRYSDYKDPYYNPNLSLQDNSFRIQGRRLARGSAKRPIRSIMCAFNLNHEGAPYSQYELTLALKEKGILEPIVYSPEDGPLRLLYEQAGIQVIISPHPLLGVFDLGAYQASIDRFATFIDDLDISLVYANTLQTFYAIAAAECIGKPSIWNVRESEPWQTYFNFLPDSIAFEALNCFAKPYQVVFVAENTKRQFEPLNSRNRFTVIHNGLNLGRFQEILENTSRHQARSELGIEEEDFVLLTVGTVCERKGQLELLDACSRLAPETWKRLRVLIVGDRPSEYSRRLHRFHEALSAELRQRISIVPEVDQPAPYYLAADCFVCTSRIESYPRVILEAMAFALPIITTPVYGIVEQVREGINADFYPAGQPQLLAERIQGLLDDPERLARYRRNAPLVLQALTQFDEMVEAYANLFIEAAELADCSQIAEHF